MKGLMLAMGILVATFGLMGCGGRAKPANGLATDADSTTVAPADELVLPEWAPESPSPEFLRAAGVLKPLPEEIYLVADDPLERVAQRVAWQEHIMPRTWELFGTLSDGQVERFLDANNVFVKVSEMTANQRAALRRLLDDFRDLEAGGQNFDVEVQLYKFGAREDLSNVEVGFATSRGGGLSKMVIFLAAVRPSKVGDPHGTYGMGAIGHL